MTDNQPLSFEKLPNHIKYLCSLCAEEEKNLAAYKFFLNDQGNIVMAINVLGDLTEVAVIRLEFLWKNLVKESQSQ